MNILITGGTGSYGNAFVKQIITQNPKRVVIYSRDEQKQEDMARAFGALGVDHPSLRFFIGDVRDRDRLEFASRGIDTIIHAAALKIVPTAEYNPTECVATNIGGAENVVKAAVRMGVRRVLALSTDKAVNPINLYGATKLAAEKIFIAANALGAGSTMFSVMRYGNVVGSRGSVIPLFKRLKEESKPITLTDRRMTRFWITLDQAVEFTMDCLSAMGGREIYVPKLPSMRIRELIAAIAGDRYPILISGIRPGEKLHETLITEDEARSVTELPRYYVIKPGTKGTMDETFRYQSDKNDLWLSQENLKQYIVDWERHNALIAA